MVRAAIPLFLVFVISSTAYAQRQNLEDKDWPVEIRTKHYRIKSNATKEQAEAMGEYMDLVFETYTALLKPDDPEVVKKARSTLILHKDQKDYFDHGAPQGSGAYYSPQSKILVGYHHASLSKPFFAHEGMHQFTDLTSKHFRNFPMWFTEGIADCIGNCEVRRGKLYMCVKSGMIARMRLPIIQNALETGKAYSLKKLLTLGRREFMANASLCYAQSWSFCHFLMTYPKEEERSKQIPNGKFRRRIATYYELVRSGKYKHQKAWDEAFKDIPLAELEKAWKKYVTEDLDAGRFLGFNGGEITKEKASSLGLEEGWSGIDVSRIAPDSAAEGAGMKKGDVIIKFNGKRLPRGDAMGVLRIELQGIAYGKSAKVVVIRDGEELDLVAKWKKKKKK